MTDLLFSVTSHPVIPHSALPALAALVDLVLVPGVLHQGLVVSELRVTLGAERQPRTWDFDQDRVGGGAVGGKSLVGDIVQPDITAAAAVGGCVGGGGQVPHWSHAEAELGRDALQAKTDWVLLDVSSWSVAEHDNAVPADCRAQGDLGELTQP